MKLTNMKMMTKISINNNNNNNKNNKHLLTIKNIQYFSKLNLFNKSKRTLLRITLISKI